MNKDVRRYFNKLGMLYKKFIPGGGYLGVRVFTMIDEYYYNNKNYDTQYKVGLNLGKFKTMTSSRAEIEVSLYIKESLILVDHISKILTNAEDGEITHYSQKSFCYRDKGNLKLEVESMVLLKKRSNNDYVFAIVYKSLDGEVIDRFQIDLDKYDLIELHNLLRSFSQISYNLTINLAVSDFYSNINADTKAKRDVSKDTNNYNEQLNNFSNIPNNMEIPISVENVTESELNIDTDSSFGLKVPTLTSIDIKVDKNTIDQITNSNLQTVEDVIVEPSEDMFNDFKNDVFGDMTEDIPEEESTSDPEETVVEEANPVEEKITPKVTENSTVDESETIPEEKANDEIDYSEYSNKFGSILFNIIQANYKFKINTSHKTIMLNELDSQSQMLFEQSLNKAIYTIRNYNLSAYNIKPAFIVLLLNTNLKETIDKLKVSYDDRGLYYLLQALLIIDRTKSDDIMFKEEQANLMKEKTEESLKILTESYNTRFEENSTYHKILNQHF